VRIYRLILLAIALAAAVARAGVPAIAAPDESRRKPSALHNSFVRLTKQKSLKIVVIGNSVAHGSDHGGKTINFYSYVHEWFRTTFPDANIELKTGIIFAIGPELQLFRMEDKVFARRPDLVLVEFGAANGAWGDAGKQITERATEGYIRRLRMMMPQADCIMNMGLFKSMLDKYRAGATPASVRFQRDVAKHYGCALADTQRELARRILAGEPWKTYMGDVIHPNALGYEVHGQVLVNELKRQYELFEATPPERRKLQDHPLPRKTVHKDPWASPRFVPAHLAGDPGGFVPMQTGPLKYIAAGKPGLTGSFQPGKGRIVGLLMRRPDDCGNIEVSADGGGWVRLSGKREPQFTDETDRENKLQRFFFAAHGLPLYSSRIDFRVSAEPETKAAYNVQIVAFLVIE